MMFFLLSLQCNSNLNCKEKFKNYNYCAHHINKLTVTRISIDRSSAILPGHNYAGRISHQREILSQFVEILEDIINSWFRIPSIESMLVFSEKSTPMTLYNIRSREIITNYLSHQTNRCHRSIYGYGQSIKSQMHFG